MRACTHAYIHTLLLGTRLGSHPTPNLEPSQACVNELMQIDTSIPPFIALSFFGASPMLLQIKGRTLHQQKDYDSLIVILSLLWCCGT